MDTGVVGVCSVLCTYLATMSRWCGCHFYLLQVPWVQHKPPAMTSLGPQLRMSSSSAGVGVLHTPIPRTTPEVYQLKPVNVEHGVDNYVSDVQAICSAHGDDWSASCPQPLHALTVAVPRCTGRSTVTVRGAASDEDQRSLSSTRSHTEVSVKVWGDNLGGVTKIWVLFNVSGEARISIPVLGRGSCATEVRSGRIAGGMEWVASVPIRLARVAVAHRVSVRVSHSFGEFPIMQAAYHVRTVAVRASVVVMAHRVSVRGR